MRLPSTSQEWFDVAFARAADAEAMLSKRDTSNGPVYMAGWAVECALNGCLRHHGTARPRSQPSEAQHDLRRLWLAAGFQLRDLDDTHGCKSQLIDSWGTHLRYTPDCPRSLVTTELVDAARQITGFIQNTVRRRRIKR